MARPQKNNCEYFSHDASMRNHKKVRALRKKFPNGYAIWSMLLEYMTDAEFNRFPNTDLEFEFIAGDFEFDSEEIKNLVQYALQIDMLQESDGFISSKSLDERLKSVYDKRNRQRDKSLEQPRENGKFSHNNTDVSELSLSKTTQSKVKEIKLNNSSKEKNKQKVPTRNRKTKAGAIAAAQIKIEGKMFLPADVGELPEAKINSSIELLKITSQQIVTKDEVVAMWGIFKIQNLTGKKWYNSIEDVESHFINWVKSKNFKKELNNGRGVQKSNTSVGKTFTPD